MNEKELEVAAKIKSMLSENLNIPEEELDYEVFYQVIDGQSYVPQHRELTAEEQSAVVKILTAWIEKQKDAQKH